MGYIEFFYKKFPGKSNDFQGGGFAAQNGGNFHRNHFSTNREKVSERGPLSKFEGGGHVIWGKGEFFEGGG